MPPFKNQLRNILHDEIHLHGIILVHLTSNVALKTRKCLQTARYRIFFLNRHNSKIHLPHSLTDHGHKPRGQTKQRKATILRHNNKFTSGMCLSSVCPLRLFSFIFNQSVCLLHPTKPYRGVNFLYQHFL